MCRRYCHACCVLHTCVLKSNFLSTLSVGEPESERVKLDTYIYAMSISKVCELKTAAIATMPNIHINAYDGDQVGL